MVCEKIEYDMLVQDALRGVVREVLLRVSKFGLPGKHHFFITFRTKGFDVEIPSYLVASYPERMTILLQHCFQGLQVEKTFFGVILSFNGTFERLLIPFSAIELFSDPSACFELSLKPSKENFSKTTEKSAMQPSYSEIFSKKGEQVANIFSLNAFRKL